MVAPRIEDVLHINWLYKVLTAVADNTILAQQLRFKGGTCGAMLGYLNRFSVDLDFDYLGDGNNITTIREELEKIITVLGLSVKEYSKRDVQYLFKYPTEYNYRNTLKVELGFPPNPYNQYQACYFPELGRTLQCQTVETMFSNKLIAAVDRYQRKGSIAGRDYFDISQFFQQKIKYHNNIIESYEPSGIKLFFAKLIKLTNQEFNEQVVNEDLNMLLLPLQFQLLRKTMKQTVLHYLQREYDKL